MGSNKTVVFKGVVHNGSVFAEKGNRYMNLTVPFRDIRDTVAIEQYNSANGRGIQRAGIVPHQKKLAKAMQTNNYTASAFTAMVRPAQQKSIVINSDGTTTIELERGKDTLLSLDGSQRTASLTKLYEAAEDEATKERILSTPIPLILLVDGNPAEAFLNANSGAAVARLHSTILKSKGHLTTGGLGHLTGEAIALGKFLATDKDGPFHNLIRLDTRGNQPLPLTTLMSPGGSDRATSLIGLAQIGQKAKFERKTLSEFATKFYMYMQENYPDTISEGRPLSAPNVGTKGSATMFIGMANLLAYAAWKDGGEATEEIVSRLAEAALAVFGDNKITGSYPSSYKRQMMGAIAVEFFDNLEEPKHEGVPIGLVKLIGAGALNLSKLKKDDMEAIENGIEEEVEAAD